MWQQLGMAPTRDVAAIRGAFRARMLALKRSGLHEDLGHVQPLRQAYEAALRAAAGTVDDEPADTPSPMREGPVPPVHSTAHADTCPPEQQAVDAAEDEKSRDAWTQSEQPEERAGDLEALAAEAVRRFLRSGVPPAHLPRRWRRLCQQSAWQPPAAARVLQQALAHALMDFAPTLRAHQSQSAAVVAAMRLSQRWLALTVFAADLHRWWPPRPPGDAAHEPAAGALWSLTCSVSVDLLLQWLHRRQVSAACRQLDQWLKLPVMQALDSRASWLSACADRLSQWPDPPAELVDALLGGFGLQDLQPGDHPEPAIDTLVVLHRAQQRQRLLHRIAQGRQPHPLISPEMAAALLQVAIRPSDRHAVRSGRFVDGKPWLVHMRCAIAWLREHAPDALDLTEPAVLRWWCGPHVTPQDWWLQAAMLGAVAGGVVALLLFAWRFGAAMATAVELLTLAGLLTFLLLGMAVGAWCGLRAGAAITWMHMHWCTWVYPAWRRRDASWARRIPLIGALLPKLNIWLSRDLLVLWGLFELADGRTLVACIAYLGWRLALWVAARGRF